MRAVSKQLAESRQGDIVMVVRPQPRPKPKVPASEHVTTDKNELPLSVLAMILNEVAEELIPAFCPAAHKAAETALDDHFIQGAAMVTEVDSVNHSLSSCSHPSKAARDSAVVVELMEGFLNRLVCAFPLATHITQLTRPIRETFMRSRASTLALPPSGHSLFAMSRS